MNRTLQHIQRNIAVMFLFHILTKRKNPKGNCQMLFIAWAKWRSKHTHSDQAHNARCILSMDLYHGETQIILGAYGDWYPTVHQLGKPVGSSKHHCLSSINYLMQQDAFRAKMKPMNSILLLSDDKTTQLNLHINMLEYFKTGASGHGPRRAEVPWSPKGPH